MTRLTRTRRAALKVFGIELSVHAEPELVSDVLCATGEWEPFETKLLTSLLHPDATLLDIGANIGYYAVVGARIAKRVIAFEPDADNFQLLAENTRELKNVTIHALGLAEAAGRMAFETSTVNRGDHRLSRTDADVLVEVVRGDDVVEGKVDFVKIDTQGAEVWVLRGLRETLRASRPTMIIEFWPQALERLGCSARMLLEELEPLELPLWIIDHDGASIVPATLAQLQELADTIMAPDTGGFMNILVAPNDSRLAQFISR